MTLPLRISDEIKQSTEDWLAEIHRRAQTKPEDLTAAQQLALLSMSRSQIAAACVKRLRSSTVRCSAADYQVLVDHDWARRTGPRGHLLTPVGKMKADILARIVAKALGIHITITRGDSWNGFSVSCTCGWQVWHGKYGHAALTLEHRAQEHLQSEARRSMGH